ncbi:MAG: hypothetical protein JWP89_2595 [Schlesneria sp.]|nr:hypothetical protein [Schlesneria sp.]
MICTIITASALLLSPVTKANYHSVDYFDKQNFVTERVLDRLICFDIDRVQAPNQLLMADPKTTPEQKRVLREKAAVNAGRNAIAVSNHCKHSPRVGPDATKECNLN